MTGVSTQYMNQMITSRISQLQTSLATLQQQAASGKKTQNYGDLGSDAQPAIELSAQLAAFSAYDDTISQLQSRTDVMDKSLSAIRDTITPIQIMGMEVATGSQTGPTPAQLQTEAAHAIDLVTGQLQTQLAGRFLYSGTAVQTAPMNGVTQVTAATTTAVTNAIMSAPASVPTAIMTAVNGVLTNTATPYYPVLPIDLPAPYYVGSATPIQPTRVSDTQTVGWGISADAPGFQQVMQGLYVMATTPLPSPAPATPPQIDAPTYQAVIQQANTMLTQGLSAVNAMVTNNGEVQQQLVNAANEHTDTKNIMQTEFGTLTDANLAEVATKLSGLQTQLSAVYSITAQLRNLTLIQYLS